jgi:hypothetical protein
MKDALGGAGPGRAGGNEQLIRQGRELLDQAAALAGS